MLATLGIRILYGYCDACVPFSKIFCLYVFVRNVNAYSFHALGVFGYMYRSQLLGLFVGPSFRAGFRTTSLFGDVKASSFVVGSSRVYSLDGATSVFRRVKVCLGVSRSFAILYRGLLYAIEFVLFCEVLSCRGLFMRIGRLL